MFLLCQVYVVKCALYFQNSENPKDSHDRRAHVRNNSIEKKKVPAFDYNDQEGTVFHVWGQWNCDPKWGNSSA